VWISSRTEIEFPDMPVPLVQMPQTGVESMVGALTTGLMVTAFASAVISKNIRKAMKEDK